MGEPIAVPEQSLCQSAVTHFLSRFFQAGRLSRLGMG